MQRTFEAVLSICSGRSTWSLLPKTTPRELLSISEDGEPILRFSVDLPFALEKAQESEQADSSRCEH